MNESNRLPGSEKLTKPEEIGQLSKYLKKIKESIDESIRLEDQLVGVSGFSTGKIPEVDKLGNKSVKVPGNKEDVSLSKKILEIQGVEIEELGKKSIKLENTKEKVDLGNKIDEVPGNIKTNKLEDRLLKIDDQRKLGLEDKQEKLRDDRKVTLEDKRLDIEGLGVASLENKRINITDNTKPELETKKIGIKNDSEVELGEKKVGLKVEENLELRDKKLGLLVEDNIGLSDTRLDIQDARNLDLGNKRLKISVDKETELNNKKVKLEDERKIELAEKIIDLKDDTETELEDKKIRISDKRSIELGDKKVEIKDDRDLGLTDKKIGLKDNTEIELGDKKLEIKDDRDFRLADKKVELENNTEINLGNKKLELTDDRTPSLSDKIFSLIDDSENELANKKVRLIDDREVELGNTRLVLEDNRDPELGQKILVTPENENGEPIELYDAVLGMEENENGEPTELYRSYLGMADDKGSSPNIFDADSLREYTSRLSDSELYEFAMKIASEGEDGSGETGGWLQKIEGLMSSYLSADILTPKRAIEFRDAINNTLEMSYFGSQTALRVPVDTSSGTTWAKAEELVGEQITGTNRRDALDEMIVKLVDYRKSNLPSLPGSDVVGALKTAAKNVAGRLLGTSDSTEPMNKPLHLNGSAIPGGYGDTTFQAANTRTTKDSLDPTADTLGGAFYKRYWSSDSFKATLEELCPIVGKAPVASLAELKALLKASPYFTTPGKFMTDTKGSYNTFSLDTNMYWEVTIEPFCCNSGSCNNGGYSFLPSIREINFINKTVHGVSTSYGYWAPINSFELQKSKLMTKSLPLYEGEIAYPTGMDFTNELRLSFVDDAWKSWKRYFERCAEVSVYNSEAHQTDFYKTNITNFGNLTKIDKTNFCVAYYKNVVFNIKIYILNPQLNLLNRFNLLCLLKDYSEEYIGEVDSGGSDLNVTFSIVGENPEEDKSKQMADSMVIMSNIGRQVAFEAQKRITGAINSSVGLI